MRLIRTCAVIVTLLSGLCFGGVAHAQVNLLTNGNFSSGFNGLAGWSVQWNGGSCTANCETVTGMTAVANSAQVSFVQFGFGASYTLANVQQGFQTVAGQRYVLSFVYGSYGDSLSGTSSKMVLYVYTDLSGLHYTYYTFTPDPTKNYNVLFQDPSLSFVGDGGFWTFAFVDRSTQSSPSTSNPADLVLTNVALVYAPEPASLALLLVAFAGLIAARHRRRT